ncbi:histidine phosphatase family protein [Candidatus Saccharibacteria bacterium]|nr:histidine phosphatase family protein [Candidatus Saccharibacteria bacterium]
MKLYLVRHGQTDWNVQMLAQGRTDIPLNSTGIAQAEALRDRVKDYKFDICYCSPLVRAAKTAEIVVDGRCKIVPDKLLVERCFGKYEGTSPTDDWLKYWHLDCNDDEMGMEPLTKVFERSKEFLEKIRKNHSSDASILIVGHGGMLKTLHYNIVGYEDDTDFMSMHFKNGDIWEYEL